MSTGNLIIQTRAADDALPVTDAAVTVYMSDADGMLQPAADARTDRSGSSPVLPLSAPAPGTDVQQIPPYALYRVDISHPGYRPVTVLDVAVFSGITTNLPITMVPPRTPEEQTKRIIINSAESGPTGSGVQ